MEWAAPIPLLFRPDGATNIPSGWGLDFTQAFSYS